MHDERQLRIWACGLAAKAERARRAGDSALEAQVIRAAQGIPGLIWEIWSSELVGVRRMYARVMARRAAAAARRARLAQ